MKLQVHYRLGTLPKDVIESVLFGLHDYGYWVELNDTFLNNEKNRERVWDWLDGNLEKRASIAENCQAQPYTHYSVRYMVVDKGRFFGFFTEDEKRKFLASFPELVKESSPFTITAYSHADF